MRVIIFQSRPLECNAQTMAEWPIPRPEMQICRGALQVDITFKHERS